MTFSGVVNRSAPQRVGLFADPHPYRGWRRLSTKRVTGGVTFRVRPAINTRYQLRIVDRPAIRSKTQQVYVDLAGRLQAFLLGAGQVEVRYRGRARVPVTSSGGRVHFYIREDGRGPLRKIGTGTPRQADPRAIVVTLRRRDPDPGQRDRFVSCAVGLLAEGFGHPRPSDPGCGRPVLAATERRLSAPG